MKTRSLFATTLLFGSIAFAQAVSMPETQLDYSVQYKWGFIDVAIGNAVANVAINDDVLSGTLAGHSIPWEGRIFSVGDTVKAVMTPTTQTNDYINGWYRKPHANETVDTNSPANYRSILGQGDLNCDGNTLEAITITAQMLGMFYYAQELDFDAMSPGEKHEIEIDSNGLSPEKLVITYNGKGLVGSRDIYHIDFEYSYGGEMSNYPVACQIAADTRIPIYFGADIKIGHVDMFLNEN